MLPAGRFRAGDGSEPGRRACLPRFCLLKWKAASLGRGSRDCLLTPAKLLLFPEVVFKAEQESG